MNTLRDCQERDFVMVCELNREAQIWAFQEDGVLLTDPNTSDNSVIAVMSYECECIVLPPIW